jgi:hypothetical protein
MKHAPVSSIVHGAGKRRSVMTDYESLGGQPGVANRIVLSDPSVPVETCIAPSLMGCGPVGSGSSEWK